MKINSKYFGELEVDDSIIISFDTPIPGFEDVHKYFIITEDETAVKAEEKDSLFCWLHSAEEGKDIAFALLDVFRILDNYTPEIGEEYLAQIEFEEGDMISVNNIVNIPDDIKEMTVNLVAPIVINITKRKGIQVILNNENYVLKQKIFEQVKKVEDNKEA